MQFQPQVPLAPYTTLGVGGPARWFAEAASEDDIGEALEFARQRNLPLFVLGGGSNLLVADAGYDGLVLHIALRGVERQGDIYRAGAGEDWDALVAQAVAENLAGVECLSGIPGTVGGTPVQNVGAYGQDVAETIVEVRAIEAGTGKAVIFSREECAFSYRRSRFNGQDAGKYILTSVSYKLRSDGAPALKYPELRRSLPDASEPSLAQVRETVKKIRRSKGMLLVAGDPDCHSAGSFFKNPIVDLATADRVAAIPGNDTANMPRYPESQGRVKLSAAWLIEQAGIAKGFTLGRAGVSSRHTLALINRGGAAAAELRALRDHIRAAVEERFGVWLEQEPVMLG
jgi:UDP-N-acetylmuramate dehydrogenase